MQRITLLIACIAFALTLNAPTARAQGGGTPGAVIAPTVTPSPPFVVGKTHFYVIDDATTTVPGVTALDTSSGATPRPTDTPLDAKIGSFNASIASNIIAAELTKRGLFAHSDYAKFWSECTDAIKANDLTRAVQFHWIVTDPGDVSQQNPFIGLSWTQISIAWSVDDCEGRQIVVSGADSNWDSRIYRKNSWRIPLSQILALVQLTNVLHTNAIHAPLIAGFSAGAGSVNTYLDQANPQNQIVEQTFINGAATLAARFCGLPFTGAASGLKCWATARR